VQSFQWKFNILCPETVSRNLPVPRNLPKSCLNLPNRHKKYMRPKKPNFIWPFFKNKKRPKELKKGQKLQIWPQKSQTGNPVLQWRKLHSTGTKLRLWHFRENVDGSEWHVTLESLPSCLRVLPRLPVAASCDVAGNEVSTHWNESGFAILLFSV